MSKITDAPLQVADKNMIPAVFRNMKSTITAIYCTRKYQQSANNQYARRGDDLDTGLTCASVVLLQTAVNDKDCKWNGHSINDFELKRLFNKYLKVWSIYRPPEPQQKELFFQYYLLHERSKNKFSAAGFMAYHLIKFFMPAAIEFLKNDNDIPKATALLPGNIGMSAAHLIQPSLGHSMWAEPFYENFFYEVFDEMYQNIITFNSFLCYMQDVISKCSSDECKQDLENAFFFEYKALPGLLKIFQHQIDEGYIIGVFSKPTWLNQRVMSMVTDLERRKFITLKRNIDGLGYQFVVNVPKVDTFVASLLLLNI